MRLRSVKKHRQTHTYCTQKPSRRHIEQTKTKIIYVRAYRRAKAACQSEKHFFLVDNGRVVTEINRWIYDRDENFFFYSHTNNNHSSAHRKIKTYYTRFPMLNKLVVLVISIRHFCQIVCV